MERITVYELPGTSVQASITGQLQYITPQEVAKNPFYQGLDPDAFAYVFVQGYSNMIKPMGPSVTKGVDILTNYITQTPGKFAVIGTSQGALIASQVFKKLMNNTLPRLSDCVGFFLMGNPARQEGRAFPGATTVAAGRGVANSSYRLSNTTDLVWEFANPGDPVCTNIHTTTVGQAREAAFNNMLTSWDGNLDSLSDIAAIANDLVGMFSFATTSALDMILYHMSYGTPDWKPISGDNRNSVQIVIDRLNKVAAPRVRSDGWSTTLVGPVA